MEIKINDRVTINGWFYKGYKWMIIGIKKNTTTIPDQSTYAIEVYNEQWVCITHQPRERLDIEEPTNWKVEMLKEVNDVLNKYLKDV